MPLTAKGNKIKRAMTSEYGPEKGKEVFYASENKGKIKGVCKDSKSSNMAKMDAAIRQAEQQLAKPDSYFIAGGVPKQYLRAFRSQLKSDLRDLKEERNQMFGRAKDDAGKVQELRSRYNDAQHDLSTSKRDGSSAAYQRAAEDRVKRLKAELETALRANDSSRLRRMAKDAVPGVNTKCPDCGERFKDGIDFFPSHNAADGRACKMSNKPVQKVAPRYADAKSETLHRALDHAIDAVMDRRAADALRRMKDRMPKRA